MGETRGQTRWCIGRSMAVFRRATDLAVGAGDRDAAAARAIGVRRAIRVTRVADSIVEGQARRLGTTGRIVVPVARGTCIATTTKLRVDAKAFGAVCEGLATPGFETILVLGAAWPAAAVVRIVREHAGAAAARRWFVGIRAGAALVAMHFASRLALVCRRTDLGARIERVRAAAGRTIVVRGAGLSTRFFRIVRFGQTGETLAALGVRAAGRRVRAAEACQGCRTRAA